MSRVYHLSLRQKIAAAFGSAAAALVVGTVALASMARELNTSQWVSHTHSVIEHVDRLLERMTDAETGQRGYLITGDSSFLAPYRTAGADVHQELEVVRQLTIDNAVQQRRITVLVPLVDAKLATLDTGIALRDHVSPAAAIAFTRRGEGHETMEEIRSVIGGMKDEEQRLLTMRRDTLHQEERATMFVLIIGSILAGLLTAVTISVVARAAREQEELNAQLQEQATILEEQAAELEATNEELQVATEELAAQTEEAQRGAALEKEARADAELANRAKSEFLATMSHELRTPLNAIAGYAEVLTLGLRGPITPEQLSDLERIQRSQRHLLGLINSILGFARLEAGQEQFIVTDVPVAEGLSSAESLVYPQLQEKGLDYDTQAVDPTVVIRADAAKFTQILLNLLSNAVKFTDEGGRVSVGCHADDDAGYVTVRDTGRGIPREKLGIIFEPFVQVERELSHPIDGVGLGLSISRNLARHMGGDLSAESALGEGSTFTLRMPLAKPASEAAEERRAGPRAGVG